MGTHKAHPSEGVYKYLLSSKKKLADPAPAKGKTTRSGAQGEGGGEQGYIDLLLIHSPFGGEEGRANTWDAFVRAQKEGWVRDIGVSNL